jgi:ABC-2 type transport system permease protein
MVATVLRIRFRVLGNTLARNPWQLVGFLFGAFGALWMLVLAAVGLFLLGNLGLDTARYTVTGAGAALTLGWVVGPVFAAGVDTTLDPAKLAPFPLSTNRMMLAIAAGGATGVPGIASGLGALATFAVWWRWPAAALAAVVCVPLGFAICVVASRAIASFAAGLGGRRRTREFIGLIAFAVLIFASPLILGILSLVEAAAEEGARITTIVEGLSWTPIAAAWAVPGDLAAGSPVTAALKALIAAATLAVLWMLWHRSLSASLIAPPSRSAGRRVKAGAIGWFGVLPTGATGATWARGLTYWLRDLRYVRQLLLVPFLPVVILLSSQGDATTPLFALSGILVAFFLGLLPYTDVSYDGTAFASVLQTGIRGRADRAGRMLAAASIGFPLLLIATVGTVAIAGRWDLLPAVLGASIALLFAGYGVSAVSSALLIVPSPASGDSPFKRVPGATFTMFLAFLLCWLAATVLASPAIALAVVSAVTSSSLLGWLALLVGIAIGIVVFLAGIMIGGRQFDRTAPALLFRLQSLKGS